MITLLGHLLHHKEQICNLTVSKWRTIEESRMNYLHWLRVHEIGGFVAEIIVQVSVS